jgi:hypothetical protein
MNWKTSLDKYLTNPPDNGFDFWCDKVIDHLSDEFYNLNENWIMEYDGQCNKWLNKLFKSKNPEQAAKIIERGFGLFKLS